MIFRERKFPKKVEGGVIHDSQPIIQYDMDGNFMQEYDSISDAAAYMSIDKGSIINFKKHKIGMSNNYVWKIKEEGKEVLKKIDTTYFKNSFKRPVCQYDLKGNYIKSYETVSEAAKDIKKSIQLISMACSDSWELQKSAGGFVWRYKDNKSCPKNIVLKNKERKIWCGKIIHQYDLNGNYIQTFQSIKKAATHICRTSATITNVYDKPNRTAGGFKWSTKK